MVLCIVIGSMMPCFAWVNRANLTTSEPWKFSEGIASSKIAFILKGKTISYNEGDSEHSVYFIHATYANASDPKSSYGRDTSTLVAPGNMLLQMLFHQSLLQRSTLGCCLTLMEQGQQVVRLMGLKATLINKIAIFY